MSHYVPVETPGGTIMVEVDSRPEGWQPTGLRFRPMTFKEAVDSLKKNAEFMYKKLADLAPSEIEVSFGIKAGVEGSTAFFALAKANAEGSYTVTLRWKEAPEGSGTGHQDHGE